MKFSYIADSREVTAPAGYEREFKAIQTQSKSDEYLIRITVENIPKLRTEGMNAKFHAMCRELARQAGDASTETVDYIKDMAKSIAVNHFYYPVERDKDGLPIYGLNGKPVGLSTAKATAEQMTMLMEALRMLAVNNGYEWRDDNG